MAWLLSFRAALSMHRRYATNLYGSTALHLAIMHNHLDVAHLLVRRDCETGILKQALDCRNRRASDYCSSSAARAALNTLFEASAAGMLDLVQQMVRRVLGCVCNKLREGEGGVVFFCMAGG